MFLAIGVGLLVLWLLGFVTVGGAFIHILLIIGLIAIVWHFMKGSRPTARL